MCNVRVTGLTVYTCVDGRSIEVRVPAVLLISEAQGRGMSSQARTAV